eukprot:15365576-Ditylum_brightwellii.AAC.1
MKDALYCSFVAIVGLQILMEQHISSNPYREKALMDNEFKHQLGTTVDDEDKAKDNFLQYIQKDHVPVKE